MSIQEWAAAAEIVGAIAVVASLIYLAIQIRQNTSALSLSVKSTELAAFERNVESGNRIREMFIVNPDVSELYLRGLKSYADLAEGEKLRFDMVLSNVFSALQGAYVRQQTYYNDLEDFSGTQRMLDQLIGYRADREWLGRSRPDWRPEFASLVERRVGVFEAKAREASAEGQERNAEQTVG